MGNDFVHCNGFSQHRKATTAKEDPEQLIDKLVLYILLVNEYILPDYTSERIGFNIINKRHTKLIIYTMLVKIR